MARPYIHETHDDPVITDQQWALWEKDLKCAFPAAFRLEIAEVLLLYDTDCIAWLEARRLRKRLGRSKSPTDISKFRSALRRCIKAAGSIGKDSELLLQLFSGLLRSERMHDLEFTLKARRAPTFEEVIEILEEIEAVISSLPTNLYDRKHPPPWKVLVHNLAVSVHNAGWTVSARGVADAGDPSAKVSGFVEFVKKVTLASNSIVPDVLRVRPKSHAGWSAAVNRCLGDFRTQVRGKRPE